MKTIKNLMRNRDPHIFHGFVSSASDALAELFRASSKEIFVKEIHCICGSESFFLDLLQSKESKGVCSKSEFIEYKPPVYTVCSACKKSQLLFDPVIHGWNGEIGIVKDSVSPQKLGRYSLYPGRIYVAYSYSAVEEYDRLLSEGIDDIENYFESFTAFFAQNRGSTILKVFTTKCK